MEEDNEKLGEFAIFKKKGAAKFKPMHLRRDDRGFVSKPGAILLEMAPSVGTREDGLPLYDWTKKITFAIGVPDIIKMLENGPKELTHQTSNASGDITKKIKFVPGEGQYVGSWQMMGSTFTNTEKNNVFVPISAGEWIVLQRLLLGTIPKLIGWE